MYVNGAKDSELAVSGKTTNLSKDNLVLVIKIT